MTRLLQPRQVKRRPKGPISIERQQVRLMRRIWKEVQKIIDTGMAPLLQAWPSERSDAFLPSPDLIIGGPPIPETVSGQSINSTMAWIRAAIAESINERTLSPLIARAGERMKIFSARDLNAVMGSNVARDVASIDSLISEWIRQNVDLIESGIRARQMSPRLRPSLLAGVEQMVQNHHAQGLRVEVLRGSLKERYSVSNARADLIARDQILKLNSNITQERQTVAGISSYRWSTSRDERVRDRHAELEGQVFYWDSPPDVGHPGISFQCRCIAVPIPPAWMS